MKYICQECKCGLCEIDINNDEMYDTEINCLVFPETKAKFEISD